jgi:hypothetical protein
MPSQLPSVKVAPERLEQLKALSAKLGLSLSDTIAHLIRGEIARGTIPDVLPGISIKRTAKHVELTVYSQSFKLPPQAAMNFADNIEKAASGKIGGVLDLDDHWQVVRVGNGIKIGERPFSRDVANDIARLLRIAAA